MNLNRRLCTLSLFMASALYGCASAAREPSGPGAPADVSPAPHAKRAPGWYQWRGPEQNGVSREKNLPDKWSPDGENLLWSVPIGGMSSPIVLNGKLYTYTRDAEVPSGDPTYPTLAPGIDTQEAFVCLDTKDGHVLWKHTDPMFQTDVPFHRLGWSNPVGDPATGRVYGLGSQANLACFDGDSGKVVWQHQMTEEYGAISTFGGRTPSPALDEDALFIGGVAFGWGDNARAQYRLFCFDKNTGQLRWTSGTGGLPVDAPYNTPVIAVVNGERLVITPAGDGGIHAFQARTGKKVWSFKASLRGMNTSVIVDGDYVYVSHDLDNPDTTELGRVYCLDGAHTEPGKPGTFGAGPPPPSPKEVWRMTGKPAGAGIPAGFPSSTLFGDRLYVEDDAATVWALDKKTGKVQWSKKCGTTGKASLTWGDGKLYVGEANGKFWVLKDDGKKAEVVSHTEVPEKMGREYAIFGSVAIDDGRIYLETANKTYCIGEKDRKAESDPIPDAPVEEPAPKGEPPSFVQVVPADAALKPGEKVQFAARLFDAKGRLLGVTGGEQVKWSIGQLTLPAAPPPPKVLPPPTLVPVKAAGAAAPADPTASNSPPPLAAAPGRPAGITPGAVEPEHDAGPHEPHAEKSVTQPSVTPATVASDPHAAAHAEAVAKAATQPTTGPTKVGNLKGEVDPSGTFTAVAGPPQGGAIVAAVGDATGQARVRVLPPLPWKIDFESSPVGTPPLTWIGAGGKFAVVPDPDNAQNKVLQKLLNIDLYYRARTYAGTPDMADYTTQADVKVNEKIAGAELHEIPDAGIIDSHYVLVLLGNDQKLQLIAWPAAVPDERQPSGSLNRTINFPWKAKTWYRLKLQVRPAGQAGLTDARVHVAGKAWPAEEPEPKEWLVEMEDKLPNRAGSPGLFGNSLVGEQKSEIYYDNILVTPNEPEKPAAAHAEK